MSSTASPGRRRNIPATPRVISPSPTPSERLASQDQLDGEASYNGPMTRSARKRLSTPQPVEEESYDEDENEKKQTGASRGAGKGANKAAAAESSDSSGSELRRARTRSRSPIITRRLGELTPAKAASGSSKTGSSSKSSKGTAATNGKTSETQKNGHLRPPPLNGIATAGGWSWRDFSRSPSPLGLIPIHRHWRSFVHKHEVPRKLLHVSIGFLVMWLYASGTQTRSVCPYLMGALIPIASIDLLRHRYAPFNRLYVRLLGALMRESEFDGYNGVIFYLLGAWTVLYALPKDVGVISVMLLSWCDTAASTFGRMYGRYTPRLRRGKSLAGSTAAFLVGVATAAWFWGSFSQTVGPMPGDEDFMFKGTLSLPSSVVSLLGWDDSAKTSISGALALGVMSLWSGFVASASEVVDIFGWDDNLTIPVLSGLGIWAFLKVFG
ncbi:Diacylglycerol kinase [Sporothrix eucalyptigena]|uniref:Diacylglycerol kinase n=1 Tax=Sporothrix eucalyptigena TaxID=1812306 RepID=A0ABP0BMG1_9PEZI